MEIIKQVHRNGNFKETHPEIIIRNNFHLKIQSCRKLAWCSKGKSCIRHFSILREQRENLDVSNDLLHVRNVIKSLSNRYLTFSKFIAGFCSTFNQWLTSGLQRSVHDLKAC